MAVQEKMLNLEKAPNFVKTSSSQSHHPTRKPPSAHATLYPLTWKMASARRPTLSEVMPATEIRPSLVA